MGWAENLHIILLNTKISRAPFTLNFTVNFLNVASIIVLITLGPAYNEFGYNKHLTTMSRFLCIKIIDCSV